MNKDINDRAYKKTELKRLLIYLALSFALAWILFIIMLPSGSIWDDLTDSMQSFISFGMLAPLTAHALTRLITKEGFAMTGEGSMMLGISFRKRKWILYLLAVLLPSVYIEAGNIITLLLTPSLYDPEYYKVLDIDKRLLPLLPFAGIVSGTVVSFAALGEEGGWRGYMMPKLMTLMGRNKALIAGGIIWGLWHAPLTCIGHNFGTGYPGFPYTGILRMCLFCILMGVILTFLTVKTKSVWPAAFMHAVNNAQPGFLAGFINYDQLPESAQGIAGFSGRMLPMLVIAVIVIFSWQRSESRGQVP